jgi:DNA modification methylase
MESAGFEPKRIITWKKPAAVPFNRQVNLVSGCEYILWGIKPGQPRTFNANANRGTIVERYTAADKIASLVYKYAKDVDNEQDLDRVFAQAAKEAKKMLAERKRSGDTIQCVVPNTITLSNEDDTVLDTFAGSGSTGIAAQNRNRKFILIERDVKMFGEMSKQFENYGLFE